MRTCAPAGLRVDLRFASSTSELALKEGWIVERHLMDDDTVLFNRQASSSSGVILYVTNSHRVRPILSRAWRYSTLHDVQACANLIPVLLLQYYYCFIIVVVYFHRVVAAHPAQDVHHVSPRQGAGLLHVSHEPHVHDAIQRRFRRGRGERQRVLISR